VQGLARGGKLKGDHAGAGVLKGGRKNLGGVFEGQKTPGGGRFFLGGGERQWTRNLQGGREDGSREVAKEERHKWKNWGGGKRMQESWSRQKWRGVAVCTKRRPRRKTGVGDVKKGIPMLRGSEIGGGRGDAGREGQKIRVARREEKNDENLIRFA